MPRASLCLLYPRGKPELKTKLGEEGTTPGTGEDNNQSRKHGLLPTYKDQQDTN